MGGTKAGVLMGEFDALEGVFVAGVDVGEGEGVVVWWLFGDGGDALLRAVELEVLVGFGGHVQVL